MSGNEKRCAQRIIIDFLTQHFKWILFLPLIISLVAAGFYFIFPQFGSGWINILLTIVIAFFAGVQGYSTYTQKRLVEQRYRIEDLRNELKTAYGPLYTLLNKFQIQGKQKGVLLSSEERKSLDGIIATHPFMFPPEIYDFWREKIQNLEPAGSRVVRGKLTYAEYMIPMEFINRINKEYDIRVQRYKLLKKE